MHIGKKNNKCVQDCKEAKIAKITLKKKNRVGELALLYFKAEDEAALIKTVVLA